jgi:transcriptional regulator with XRE-family HTH domain
MKIEEAIGRNIEAMRVSAGLSQAELGRELGRYLGGEWSRQAVSAAEKGRRSFTAQELVALAFQLRTTVPQLMQPTEHVQMGGGTFRVEAVTAALVPDSDEAALRLAVLRTLTSIERSTNKAEDIAFAQRLLAADLRTVLGDPSMNESQDDEALGLLGNARVAAARELIRSWHEPRNGTFPPIPESEDQDDE